MDIVKRTGFFPSSFFDDFLTRDLFDWSGWTSDVSTVPKVNIIESHNEFEVIVAAPGRTKKDFQIELDNDTLVIYSDVAEDDKLNEGQVYTRREFNFGSFRRTLHLPNTVEADKIKATYKEGLLRLIIPKKEEARKKPIRTISIS